MGYLSISIQTLVLKTGEEIRGNNKIPITRSVRFRDKGQNWTGCKCHPREIEVVGEPNTKELRALICASIREDQGYTGAKITQGMIYT